MPELTDGFPRPRLTRFTLLAEERPGLKAAVAASFPALVQLFDCDQRNSVSLLVPNLEAEAEMLEV